MNYMPTEDIPIEFEFLIDVLNAQHKQDHDFLRENVDKIKIVPEGCRPIVNENDEVYGFFSTSITDSGEKKVVEIIRIKDQDGTYKYYTRILTPEEIEKAKKNILRK